MSMNQHCNSDLQTYGNIILIPLISTKRKDHFKEKKQNFIIKFGSENKASQSLCISRSDWVSQNIMPFHHIHTQHHKINHKKPLG
ncbi:hypothetical protein BRARA_H01943 [Brassica rapa]|uniref:Uncharacterized protein n=1 Tax=Brassica campestris TaxID=3711 RepID=A0A397YCR2_BRACM|nr:hypothetical protein BRARA_H01943 [Brassica rapa]